MTTENNTAETVEEVEMIEIPVKELADLRKKLEQFEGNYRYYSKLNEEKDAELRLIHQVLDNLPHKAPRSELKTEENQWPSQYNAPTRLAIWLGSKW